MSGDDARRPAVMGAWYVPGSKAYSSAGTSTLVVRTANSSGQTTTRAIRYTVS